MNSGFLPAGFELYRPDLLGTGLQLVASLLPHSGIELNWEQEGGEVVTTLEVSSPVVFLMNEMADHVP